MSFVGRALNFSFIKGGSGTFANGSTSISIPAGLQASVRISQAGAPGMASAVSTIWGMTPDVMNQVSTMGAIVTLQPRNLVVIQAGDADGSNFGTCFKGGILQGAPDFNRQPETPLVIEAFASLDIATLPAQPQSYVGASDISVILAGLCKQANYTFDNAGISGINLSNAYLWGSPRDQILSVLRAVRNRGVTGGFVENATTLSIWPTKGARGGLVPLVKPGTVAAAGTLIGYPTYTQFGVDFKCIYNPNIRFGGQVQLQTSLPSAAGLWNVYGLSHSLDAQVPNGRWETTVQATRSGYPTPVIPTV